MPCFIFDALKKIEIVKQLVFIGPKPAIFWCYLFPEKISISGENVKTDFSKLESSHNLLRGGRDVGSWMGER